MYQLTLNQKEYDALTWIGDRYSSAQVLVKALETPADVGLWEDLSDDREITFTLRESDCWDYLSALEEEDGNQIIPPCSGGPLAEKLTNLWESII